MHRFSSKGHAEEMDDFAAWKGRRWQRHGNGSNDQRGCMKRGRQGFTQQRFQGVETGRQLRGYTPHPRVASRSARECRFWREDHAVTVESCDGRGVLAPTTSFDEVPFPNWVAEQLRACGYSKPLPLQAQAWPLAKAGRDVICIADSRAGKTLAVVVPVLVQAKSATRVKGYLGPAGIIVVPTGQRGAQICGDVLAFGNGGGCSVTTAASVLDASPDAAVLILSLADMPALEAWTCKVRFDSVVAVALLDVDTVVDSDVRRFLQILPFRCQILVAVRTWPHAIRKHCHDGHVAIKIGVVPTREDPPINTSKRYVKAMLRRYDAMLTPGGDVKLRPEDEKVMTLVLDGHPERNEKVGCGIHSFWVKNCFGFGNCFVVLRLDGTSTDFSYHRCFPDFDGQHMLSMQLKLGESSAEVVGASPTELALERGVGCLPCLFCHKVSSPQTQVRIRCNVCVGGLENRFCFECCSRSKTRRLPCHICKQLLDIPTTPSIINVRSGVLHQPTVPTLVEARGSADAEILPSTEDGATWVSSDMTQCP
eukprot:TRINITY_DN13124_c0_g1_i1.p1 TRINITY_DN13124_c0_g1~~TRINITY_DN13124_c0_g1_i1.p1  ORF type:complete len:537 (+),score=57.67 TRINITY_DN13124_c0_g1_i1:46-1656(+)